MSRNPLIGIVYEIPDRAGANRTYVASHSAAYTRGRWDSANPKQARLHRELGERPKHAARQRLSKWGAGGSNPEPTD